MTKNHDGAASGLAASGQLKTWAADLKQLYALPHDGSFDDLVRRLERSARLPRFRGKRHS